MPTAHTENHIKVARKSDQPKKKSRTQWVADIRQTYVKSVESVLQVGKKLTTAKEALGHGEWGKIFKNKELPFTITVAERFMIIAADDRLADAATSQHLPSTWNTLYELTKLPAQTFDQAITDGIINPGMTLKDATALVKDGKNYSAEKIVQQSTGPPKPLQTIVREFRTFVRQVKEAIQHHEVETGDKNQVKDFAEELIAVGHDLLSQVA